MNKPLHHRLEPKEVVISAEEVLELPLGSKVRIHGEDRRGVHQWTDCIVAGHKTRKFLTYRSPEGLIKRCSIQDYPKKYYTKVV